MLAVEGIYENGKIVFKKKIKATKPVKVIVTFLEDVEASESKKLDLKKFSFNRSKELLKNYAGSLSDVIVEERRSAL